MFCGETIIPKGTRGSQLSFKFTIRSFLPGCVYAITGPSGSGKTTLLSLLAGVDLPQKGSVEFDGISTAQRNLDEYRLYHAAVIYQKFNLFSHLTAVENVAYPLLLRKEKPQEAYLKALGVLDSLGITRQEQKRFPKRLSGGQQQRIAIARALLSGNELILADEPTGSLDRENGKKIMEILCGLAHEKNRCVILVTHDAEIASAADVMLKMCDGKLYPAEKPAQTNMEQEAY